MCMKNFWKGMGAGLAVGMAAGLLVRPPKRKYSTGAARLLKLAGSAVGELGAALGF